MRYYMSYYTIIMLLTGMLAVGGSILPITNLYPPCIDARAEQGPPTDQGGNVWETTGNWIIEAGDDIIKGGETIIANGNIIIQDGGKLTLDGTTVMMNVSSDGQYRIEVQDGGTLWILNGANITDGEWDDDSNFKGYLTDGNHRYSLHAQPGAELRIENSTVSEAGWGNSKGLHLGMWVQSNGTVIRNSEFHHNFKCILLNNCNGGNISGNYFHDNPGFDSQGLSLFNSNLNNIYNNTFTSTYIGMYLSGSGNEIYNNDHYGNVEGGLTISDANQNMIWDNRIRDNGMYNIYFRDSENNTLRNNKLRNRPGKNNHGIWIYTGVKNNLIKGMTMENQQVGIYAESHDNIFEELNIVNTSEIGFRIRIPGGGDPNYLGHTIFRNSRIVNSSGKDFRLESYSRIITEDSVFSDASVDPGCELVVKNSLTGHLWLNKTPDAGGVCEVRDNGALVSSGITDGEGTFGPVLVTDRIYYGEDTATENDTSVRIGKGAYQPPWLNLNMSRPRHVYFNESAPVLTQAGVDPLGGTNRTVFNFSVVYGDEDGDMPAVIELVLDSRIIDPGAIEPGDTNVKDGKEYFYQTMLDQGEHSFFFGAKDSYFWTQTPEIAGPRVGNLAMIEVTPSEKYLYAGDDFTFNATGYDQFGNVIPIDPVWDVSGGGTIDPETGEVQAHYLGQWTVWANQSGLSGSAVFIVLSGQVYRLEVEPEYGRMNVGQGLQFNATGYDSYGNPVDPGRLNWTSEGGIGSVNYTGYFTAGSPGNGTVTASTGTLNDSSQVEVNFPPVADAGEDKEIILGQTIILDGSASYDPDGEIVNYTWGLSPSITLYGKTIEYNPSSKGTYTWTLTVRDNEGEVGQDQVTIKVLLRSVALEKEVSGIRPSAYYYTITFEDLYPNVGDGDFNDFISDINVEFAQTGDNVEKIRISYLALARGGIYDHALRTDLDFIGVANIEKRTYDGEGNLKDTSTRQAEDGAVLEPFPSTKAAFGGLDYANTKEGETYVEGDLVIIDITLSEPGSNPVAGVEGPFDTYLHVHDTGEDIHLPHEGGDYDENGFPFALLVPGSWDWPWDTVFIEDAYPLFEDWRLSGYNSSINWFDYPTESLVFNNTRPDRTNEEDYNSLSLAHIGDIITYSLRIENDGDVAVTNITLHDIIPDGVRYLEGSAYPAPGSINNNNGTTLLTWDIDHMGVGDSVNIYLEALVLEHYINYTEVSVNDELVNIAYATAANLTGVSSDAPIYVENLPPVIEALDDMTAKAGTVSLVPVNAFDPEGEPLEYWFTPDKSFLSLVTINQTPCLRIAPVDGDQGVYRVSVHCTDNVGKPRTTDNTGFDLTIYKEEEKTKLLGPFLSFDGTPIAEANVTVTTDNRAIYTSVTGHNGYAEFDMGLDPGTYTCSVEKQGKVLISPFPIKIEGQDAVLYDGMGTPPASSYTKQQITTGDYEEEPGTTDHPEIRVLDEKGKPLSGALVTAEVDGQKHSALTNKDGIAIFTHLQGDEFKPGTKFQVKKDDYKTMEWSEGETTPKMEPVEKTETKTIREEEKKDNWPLAIVMLDLIIAIVVMAFAVLKRTDR